MATRLSIANAALTDLDEFELEFAPDEAQYSQQDFEEFGAADPGDRNATLVKHVYPQVRNSLLNAYPWTWLTETHSMGEQAVHGLDDDGNLDTTTGQYYNGPNSRPAWQGGQGDPSFPYCYRLTYPWVGSIRQVSFGSGPADTGWKVEGGWLFSTQAVETISDQRQTSEEAWPQLFVNAVILRLCYRMAFPITFDRDIQQGYKTMAAEALNDALRVDAQSHPAYVVRNLPFLEARLGGYRTHRTS